MLMRTLLCGTCMSSREPSIESREQKSNKAEVARAALMLQKSIDLWL